MSEKIVDSRGREADSRGYLYANTFTAEEIKRLGFQIMLLDDTQVDNLTNDCEPDTEADALVMRKHYFHQPLPHVEWRLHQREQET